MKCDKYKLKNGLEFLAYANDGEELSLSPFWEAELIEENVDPGKKEYCELQIIHAPESWSIKKQTSFALALFSCFCQACLFYFCLINPPLKLLCFFTAPMIFANRL